MGYAILPKIVFKLVVYLNGGEEPFRFLKVISRTDVLFYKKG